MSQVNATSSLSQIMADIDLGPSGSLQFLFAKLQMAQSQICKNEAESYMNQIETIQEEQKKCADMVELARKCQNQGKNGEGVGEESITGKTTKGKDCYPMPQELVDFMEERGLSFPNSDKDFILGAEEWDYCLKSITNYQEQVGNKTQTLMIYLQDFIGQYNSYQEGAMSAISSANQTLRTIARGQ